MSRDVRRQIEIAILVMTRREGESLGLTLFSGEQITVAPKLIDGGRARVGIEAPQSVRVLRSELDRRQVAACCFNPDSRGAYIPESLFCETEHS
jgi:sRNA-binding carbon storage regulator CsrA